MIATLCFALLLVELQVRIVVVWCRPLWCALPRLVSTVLLVPPWQALAQLDPFVHHQSPSVSVLQVHRVLVHQRLAQPTSSVLQLVCASCSSISQLFRLLQRTWMSTWVELWWSLQLRVVLVSLTLTQAPHRITSHITLT